ncbi:hypothetical protein [Planomicrobium sp. YIM 101495]|nr:hypothetical protein [Planomicrobium sp. YIM 101495]
MARLDNKIAIVTGSGSGSERQSQNASRKKARKLYLRTQHFTWRPTKLGV